MTLTDREKGKKILIAVSCVIIILGSGFLIWGIWNGCAFGTCRPGHSVTNMYFIPAGVWNGFPFGTCGPDSIPMTYTSTIKPAFVMSFLHEFGGGEPVPGPDLPRIVDYPLRQEVIDSLMRRAQIPGTEDSVIGLYEFPDSRLVLINQDTSVAEVLETYEGIRTYTLVPEPVGSRLTGTGETGAARHGSYNSSTENNVTIRRIHLVLPPPGNATVPLYMVNKTDTFRIFYPDGRSLASITTSGTFYVLYGQRVERIVAGSAVILDPEWRLCSQQTGISGEGGTIGDVKHTTKIARSSERILHANLITTGAYLQVYEASGSSTSQWKSSDSTGCSC